LWSIGKIPFFIAILHEYIFSRGKQTARHARVRGNFVVLSISANLKEFSSEVHLVWQLFLLKTVLDPF
jgi:hypothetical protein